MTRSKSIRGTHRPSWTHAGKSESPVAHVRAKVEPLSYFCEQCPFRGPVSATFFCFSVLFGGCWFNCLKCRAEVLFSIPISSRPWCVVWRKYVCYIHKLHSGMSPRAAGHHLNTNRPTVHQKRVFLNRATQNKVRYWPIEENVSRDYRKLIVHFPQGPRFSLSSSMLCDFIGHS